MAVLERPLVAAAPRAASHGSAQRFTRMMGALARTLRTIIGAPDYERYVEHVRQCHPDRAPLSRDEFHRQRLDDRYSKPGTRCC